MRKLLAIFLLLATTCSVLAAGPVQLTVPQGFEGPQSATPASNARVDAYVRKIPGDTRGTLLQVTTYDFGAQLADMPKEEAGNVAENYLMQFLGGVERGRESFSASEPTRVTLDGLPAARIEWTGTGQGFQMSGVMYCVIVGTVVVSFHTQGFSDSPAADREDALRAIQGVMLGE